MKKEDMVLGAVYYKADIIDPPDSKEERILVRKFEVTQCGEQKFQVRGARWTEQGFWHSHTEFISSLQLTPTDAVAYLSRFKEAELTRAKERLTRTVKRTEEIRTLINKWRAENHEDP